MYWLIKNISKFFCLLPRRLALRIGGFLGYLFFLGARKKKGATLKNLRLVFPQKTYAELVKITRRMFREFGMTVVDTLRVHVDAVPLSENPFTVEGKQYFDKIRQEKGIFTGIHTGSWELLNICAAKDFAYSVIVRRQKVLGLDRFLNEQRLNEGLKIIYEDDLRKLIGYLRSGYILGLVFDHGSRDSKLFAEFFGKNVPVPVGVLRIASNFKRKIYAACMKRTGLDSHRVVFFPPVEVKSREDFEPKARILNKYLEDFLRANPEGYLWWYKRFKRSKNLNIIVLSDKKPGHLKQSLSLAYLVQQRRPASSIEVIEIDIPRYKRLIFDFCNIFSSQKCFGCLRCLKLTLGRDFNRLYRYADVVISCGSGLVSLNRIFAYGQEAKSFVIHKPNIAPGKHNLIVLPSHDKGLSQHRRVVRIKGSLSIFTDRGLKEAKEKTAQISKNLDAGLVKIAVLIGGPLRKRYRKKYALELLDRIKDISLKNNYQLLITTSRRTPPFIENYLEENFKNAPLLVIANKKNYPFVSEGIMGLADIVLASSDSISMITEAASLKPTLVFDAFSVKSAKHRNFLADLSGDYLQRVDKVNLEQTVKNILDKKISLKKIDNRKVIEDVLIRKLK